jgi:hypothetical protein
MAASWATGDRGLEPGGVVGEVRPPRSHGLSASLNWWLEARSAGELARSDAYAQRLLVGACARPDAERRHGDAAAVEDRRNCR